MIYLYTGSNGSGKTLNAIKFICEKLNPDGLRPVFYYSPASKPIGIAEAGVLDWEPIDAARCRDWWDFPEGSIFLIDEVRTIWPYRDHKKPVPREVDLLADHRDKGFDFLLTAQKPTGQFDPAIQGFIEEHRHLEGVGGSAKSRHFVYQSFCNSPLKPPPLQQGEKMTVPFDKKYYSYYRSASMHTTKNRLPYKKLIPIVLAALAVPLLFYYAWSVIKPDNSPSSVASSDTGITDVFTGGILERESEPDYYDLHTPRLGGLAWTAPIYDEVTKPQSAPLPRVCVLQVELDRCTCFTQQATKMEVPDRFCRQAVAGGWFDHTVPDDLGDSNGWRVGGGPKRGRNRARWPPW